MRVVVAPDSFKGSLSALDAARAIAEGWRAVRPDDEIVELPQADGGEGTLDAMAASIPDAVFRSAGTVTGPDGRPVEGAWLELPDGTAVVELARSSGLALMERPDPLGATTRGLGETIAAALESGATRLMIALGGSASTDGGRGALDALTGVRPPAEGVVLLTDVTAPLLGPTGAASVFGPQKGAGAADIRTLEERLRAYAAGFPHADPATPGAGAAGGTAFGFLAAWGARIRPGAPELAGLTGLTAAVTPGSVLVTGEGAFDATSRRGKVVGCALDRAAEAGAARAVVVAGRLDTAPTGDGIPVAALSLTEIAGSAEAALADPARWLRRAGELAAYDLECVARNS